MNEVHNLVSFFQQVLKFLEQTLKIFVSFNLHTRNNSLPGNLLVPSHQALERRNGNEKAFHI